MATVCDYLKDDITKDQLVKAKYMAMQRKGMPELIGQLIPYVDAGDVEGFHSVWDEKKDWVYSELGEYANLFCLVVVDCQIDHILKKHEKLKIPAKITKDTFSDFRIWTERFRKANGGKCGFDGMDWMLLHLSGKLFRIGRLQYRIWDFPNTAEVYRNKKTGGFLIVATDSAHLSKDGFLTGASEKEFSPVYRKSEDILLAHTVDSASGKVSMEPAKINLKEYTCVLKAGDCVIDMHIPEDGKMDYKLTADSMERALQFFRTYFPQYDYKAFYVNSWLLCNEIYEVLPQNTNIIKFADLFTKLTSGKGTHPFVYQWIFGFDKDPSQFKDEIAKTTLQKGAKKLLFEGRWFTERSGFKLI